MRLELEFLSSVRCLQVTTINWWRRSTQQPTAGSTQKHPSERLSTLHCLHDCSMASHGLSPVYLHRCSQEKPVDASRWMDMIYPRQLVPNNACHSTRGGRSDANMKSENIPPSVSDGNPMGGCRWPFSTTWDRNTRFCCNPSEEHHSQTWLVGASGEWRKRQATCLCRQRECPGVVQHRGTAYLVARLQKMSTGIERFWDVRTNLELRIGEQAVDLKHGFQVGTSATAALQSARKPHYRHDTPSKRRDMVVLRGCVSGCGCKRDNLLFVSSFRPVCAMEYVVTHY